MDKTLLKLITLLSIFLGLALGILTAVPFIGQIAFLILMCFASVVISVFMIKNKLLEIVSVQESAVIGAIVGFVSFIAFSIVYMPIVILLLKVFKFYTNYGVAMLLNTAGIGIIILLTVFMAVLSATINAFMGFLTFYVIEFIKTLNQNENQRKNKDQFRL